MDGAWWVVGGVWCALVVVIVVVMVVAIVVVVIVCDGSGRELCCEEESTFRETQCSGINMLMPTHSPHPWRSCGLMEKALDKLALHGAICTRDCRFDSCQGRVLSCWFSRAMLEVCLWCICEASRCAPYTIKMRS